MNKFPGKDINSFRTAQELASSEPAQLKRTIAELEARIQEQDSLIAQQNEGLQSLAQKLQERESQLDDVKGGSKLDHGLQDIPDGFKDHAKIKKLEKANLVMEKLLEEFDEGFWTLFSEQRHGLEDCLKALEQLPATPETKRLYSRVKREWASIESAKKRNIVSPVNALRQLEDLERAVISYIIQRPRLTLTTAEIFRAEILMEAFVTDPELKSLSTNDSIRIISAKEEKKIYREQALRAMRRAAGLFPDMAKFEKRGKAARLIKIDGTNSKTNWACRCIITVCYMVFHYNNLLQSFDDLLDGREMIQFALLGELFR
ncbi:MAG: hypothetical protein A4E48_00048 [Methanosaeta sp. PtaU1.Bin060]|jgi:uncharacterized coiled-coil protein SlyX|nr:MAG: hypothetical protein A4E48_00048 [Methanosaeta sp. PtaU1.Bin060]